MTQVKCDYMTMTYFGIIKAKKNSKQIIRGRDGRPLIISNTAARANEADMIEQFEAQLAEYGKRPMTAAERTKAMLDANECRLNYKIEATIYQPNNIRRDLDNQITSILDALTKSGAILDDCRKYVKELSVIDGGIDKDRPRAEITITTRQLFAE